MSSRKQRRRVQVTETATPKQPKQPGRLCKTCGTRHGPPTGKHCRVDLQGESTPRLRASRPSAVSPSRQNETVEDRLQSPGGNSPTRETVMLPPVGQPGTTRDSLNLLATTVSSLATSMKAIQGELAEIRAEKINASWQHMQDLSMQEINNPTSSPKQKSSPRQKSNNDIPVTVTQLRASADNQRKAATQQASFQRQAEEDHSQGELFSKNLKSGRERVGGSDHKLIYVRWPQEAVFIGPDRLRVKYDELSQSEWTAGLTAIAAEEPNVTIQMNMLAYLSALLKDVCDFSFKAGRGAHALVCTLLEEGRLNWLDLSAIQKVRENYTYRALATGSPVVEKVHSAPSARQSSSSNAKANRGTARRRVCRNFNNGNCSHDTGHLNNGFVYDHFCTFCATKGLKRGHPEQACRIKSKAEDKANGISPS